MAYEKYIKRGNKIHGPYYYESYRDENGIARKRYLGKDPSVKDNSFEIISFGKYSKFFWILPIIFAILMTAFFFAYTKPSFSPPDYSSELSIENHSLVINLNSEELLLAKTKIVVKKGDEVREFFLDDIAPKINLSIKKDENKSEIVSYPSIDISVKIGNETINANVSKKKPFSIDLNNNSFEIYSDNLSILETSVENDTLTITTNYSAPEETNKTKNNRIEINLSLLDVYENETFEISLVYENNEIGKVVSKLPEEIIDKNITETIENISRTNETKTTEENLTELNITRTNMTIENVSKENVTTLERAEPKPIQYQAIVNKHVKWIVALNNSSKVTLPENATKITLKTKEKARFSLEEIKEYEETIRNLDRKRILNNEITGIPAYDLFKKENVFGKTKVLIQNSLANGDVLTEEELKVIRERNRKVVEEDL